MFFERYSPGVSVSQETPGTSTHRHPQSSSPLPHDRVAFLSPCHLLPLDPARTHSLVNIHRYCARGIQEYRNLSFPASIRRNLVLLAPRTLLAPGFVTAEATTGARRSISSFSGALCISPQVNCSYVRALSGASRHVARLNSLRRLRLILTAIY